MTGAVAQRTVCASDALKLAVEDAGPRFSSSGDKHHAPLLCLAGLTRSMRDFHDLRDHFAFHPTAPRRVVLMDARGRGLSEFASDAEHYSVRQEADDAASVATALDLHGATIIGTSRGGLLAMVLALTRPGLIAGSVLNDIGPRVAVRGLLRIRSQLSSAEVPESWQAAADGLKSTMGHQFSAFEDADWQHYARRTYREVNGKPAADFDPKVLSGLSAFNSQSIAPDVSAPFRALVRKPTLLLRGSYSDLLDEETLADAVTMGATPHTVQGQGHAPALQGAVLDVIEGFLRDNSL